ncbi:MAG: TetR/AcrR family transcriptional regulator [Deltaproteobacteria bacterium]|nr:TetR/AcrR family transcriptional regulator [Deltaproteobacteria bacterium]
MSACDSRRGQILQAAEGLFRVHGPARTTMAEIAREVGLGVGTLYLEFPSKDAILEALSDRWHEAVLSAMRAAAEAPHGSHGARLQAVLDARLAALLRLVDEGGHAPELVHCAAPSIVSAHARFLGSERALLEGLLREGHGALEFDAPNPELTALTLVRAYGSFSPPWVFKFPREDLDQALAAMHRLVLRGLLHRRGLHFSP